MLFTTSFCAIDLHSKKKPKVPCHLWFHVSTETERSIEGKEIKITNQFFVLVCSIVANEEGRWRKGSRNRDQEENEGSGFAVAAFPGSIAVKLQLPVGVATGGSGGSIRWG